MAKHLLELSLLKKVLSDFENFLPHLVLVGGWVPLLYARYVWTGVKQDPLMTFDIDFGIPDTAYLGGETIADRVAKMDYGRHHVELWTLESFLIRP